MTSRMRLEIGQIPQVVRAIVEEGAAETARIAAAVRAAAPRGAVIVARGTSDHAGIYARYLIEGLLHVPTGLAAPSLTTVYGTPLDWRGLLLIGLSQSGQGPDVVAVTEAARAGGALTIAVTNEPGSPLAAAADHVLLCRAGEERAVAATKTYVAELAAIAALVAGVAGGDNITATLPRLPAALADVMAAAEAWLPTAEPLVEALAASDRALVVSRGYNLPTALEVALKLKETSRIFADGYSSADLLHGPVALAGPAVPMVVFRPDGSMGRALDETVERAMAAGARPWLIGGAELAGGGERRPRALSLPGDLPEVLTPLAYVLPGQLLAETVARRRGMDPDAPIGLTKVTRTV